MPKDFKPTCSIDQIPDATKLFGPAWSIPPDGRISLGFTKFELERTDLEDARMMVKGIVKFMDRLNTLKAPFGKRPGILRVLDFDPRSSQRSVGPAEYILGDTGSSREAEGSGSFRGESSQFKEQGMFMSQGSKWSAPWRRIM
jgi:hypothetical protein